MDEFDVGGEGAGMIGHLLLELSDIGHFNKVDVQFEGLFFGGCLEE